MNPAEESPERVRSRRFVLALLLILLAVAVWIAWPFRAAVVLALFLGYALHPLYARLRRPLRWRAPAALVVLLLVAAAIVVPVALVARELAEEAAGMQAAFSEPGGLQAQAVDLLARFGVPEDQARERLAEWGGVLATELQGLALRVAVAAPEVVIGFIVFFLLLFYVLVDGERVVASLRRHLPLPDATREKLLAQTGDRVRAILLGSFLVYLVQGITAGIGWWIFGFPAPIFWGFVMTLLAILPFAGPPMVMIPAGLLAILQGNWVAGVGIIVWAVVAVGLIDDVVRPWLIGRRAGIHPALVLLGTLGGIKVLGLVGFVLGPLLLGLVGPVLRVWRDDTPDPDAPGAEPPASAPPPHRRSRAA